MLKHVTAILLLGASCPAILLAADNGAIRSITLSSGGLAQVSRSADVDGDGVIRTEVPLDQVDDILKSLVVNGSAGSVAGRAAAVAGGVQGPAVQPGEPPRIGRLSCLFYRLFSCERTNRSPFSLMR